MSANLTLIITAASLIGVSVYLLLERSLTIPGTKIPVGLDSVVGLIPIVGDAIAAALGAEEQPALAE